MSGHSHWATIKHKKGAIDAKPRQALEQAQPGHHHRRQARRRRPEHEPQAPLRHRQGSRSVDAQGQHRTGHQARHRRHRRASRSRRSPTRAIGSGGVAILVDVLTDNRNRTIGEVRKIFERGGGKMGSAGSVGYLFERKGMIQRRRPGQGRGRADGHRPRRRGRGPEGGRRSVRDHLPIPRHSLRCKAALEKAGVKIEDRRSGPGPKAAVDVDEETGRKV